MKIQPIHCVLLVLLQAAAASCSKTIAGPPEGSAVSFEVRKFDEGDDWGGESPLAFSTEGGVFAITIEPVGGDFSGWVRIEAQPGIATQPGIVSHLACNPPACDAACDESRSIQRNIRIDNAATHVCVGIRLAFGDARIIVKDIGYEPASLASAACNDGRDNDGDGTTDYGDDDGCAYANDNTEEGGRFIAGVSPPILFENPRIEHVQGYSSYSPLIGQTVTINAGTLVVTRISTDGFYLTDIDPLEPGRGYNHIYAFNFNTPWGLRECDVVKSVDGIVGEFLGFTELSYPGWQVLTEDRVEVPSSSEECPIPDPVPVTAAELSDAIFMESMEAGLVKVDGGRVSDRFVSCDLNGDGVVEWEGEEDECAVQCNEDPDCTEMTQYYEYNQWALNTGGSKIFVISREAYPEFDPREHGGEVLQLVRGTLKHIEFLEPPWLIELRCKEDLVRQGEEIEPIYRACVPPQPRGRHYDNN